MKSYQAFRKSDSLSWKIVLPIAWAITVTPLAVPAAKAATNLIVWDSGSPFADTPDVERRADWVRVPGELFTFEANPAKAASDPGYYGREYSFKGDAIVENQSLVAVFLSAKGRVVLYSKTDLIPATESSPTRMSPGRKVLEIVPQQARTDSTTISRCEILRNACDEVALKVSFSINASIEDSAIFSFGRNEIVEIRPGEKLKGISLVGSIEYGVVPGFVGDDLIYDAGTYDAADTLRIPSENLFLGLLNGETSMLVVAWPKGDQQMGLRLAKRQETKRFIESIEFDNDGQSFYLAALSAPGIWHRESLKPSHLEKDVASEWRRPFPAKWKTQLSEAGVKTTFAFRLSKGQIWRGVPGSYDYPVWFDGDAAFYHLSKKVPPGGESLIYFVEGEDTPLSRLTPVDMLKATLGRPASEAVLDPFGRKLRTHHRRSGEGVHRACTCGCTEAIQAVFEAGEEVAKKTDVKEALSDMIYFVERHVERIEEYRRFAEDLIKFLRMKQSSSREFKPFLESLEQAAQQILQEQSVQKENMKSPAYMSELARQTMALTDTKDPKNLKAYMELLKAWRAMGGAQDYVVAQCHTLTRKLCQEAGYGCVKDTKAVAVAEEVRRRCRQCLRNPDGYEVWADY
jgi:hypothetical protein